MRRLTDADGDPTPPTPPRRLFMRDTNTKPTQADPSPAGRGAAPDDFDVASSLTGRRGDAARVDDRPRGEGVGRAVAAVALLLLLGGALFAAAHAMAGFERHRHAERANRPRVTWVLPENDAFNVPPDTAVGAQVATPLASSGIDPATVSEGSVRLVDVTTGQPVPARTNIAADGGGLALTPAAPLEPGRTYRFEVTRDLRDLRGEPFEPFAAVFTVARNGGGTGASPLPIAYERVETGADVSPSKFTVVALGPSPDGAGRDLFAATADGRIFRYALSADGTLNERAVLMAVPMNNGGPRVVTGLAFDPAEPDTLWISHGVAALQGAPDFTGKLSTLSGPDFGTYRDRVVGLPRAFKDHLNFGIAFGPDGRLYLSQGSNTSVGAPDLKWNNRPERLLTAAILAVDPAKLPADAPLNVTTADGGGGYDPRAAGAPLTIHATGIRSGYDVLWHSSGRLFTAINGAGRGGNTPGVPEEGENVMSGPLMGVSVTTDDTLNDVTAAGSYHGHPNPARGEDVLMGGNPTAAADPAEIPQYPVGTQPEPNWVRPAYTFGKGFSVNGMAESRADVFDGLIRGHVFAARFSAGDDLLLIKIGPDGRVVETVAGVEGLTGLASPLSVAEHPETGHLYVSEFDTGRLVLLRPQR